MLANVVVEGDPAWMSPYGPSQDSKPRAFYSAVVTLTLGVLGRWVPMHGVNWEYMDRPVLQLILPVI